MSDIKRIAAGLTEAQRRGLLAHKVSQEWGGRNDHHIPNWSDIGSPLRRLGLIDFLSPTSSMTRLNRLGQQVRAHLERQAHD